MERNILKKNFKKINKQKIVSDKNPTIKDSLNVKTFEEEKEYLKLYQDYKESLKA